MTMDLTESIAPKSDQLNADDLLTGPRTVTIEKVNAGTAEQPVNVHLVEFPGRPFKPSKTVRRIMVAAWGKEAANYAGRRMTLYRDPTVKFGGSDVGGIRVSHLSHIDKRIVLSLTVTRGKRAAYIVEPLPDAQTPQTNPASNLITAEQLKRLWPLLSDNGLTQPDEALAWLSDVLEREVKSTKDIHADEVDRVFAELETEQP
jgi:hypothetical protein